MLGRVSQLGGFNVLFAPGPQPARGVRAEVGLEFCALGGHRSIHEGWLQRKR